MPHRDHILIVDDDDDVRDILRLALEAEGISVETAANGREALAALEKPQRPALMLLDLRMPELDGWQTIDTLRARGELDDLHIVVCTSAPADAPPGFRVLAKPVDLDQLLRLVDSASA